jgi:hypothetical protein
MGQKKYEKTFFFSCFRSNAHRNFTVDRAAKCRKAIIWCRENSKPAHLFVLLTWAAVEEETLMIVKVLLMLNTARFNGFCTIFCLFPQQITRYDSIVLCLLLPLSLAAAEKN